MGGGGGIVTSKALQWRIQDLSEGQAQSQDSSVNTTSDVIAKRSLEGEALAFLGGSGGMLPRKILKSRCSDMRFQPFWEYFWAWIKAASCCLELWQN